MKSGIGVKLRIEVKLHCSDRDEISDWVKTNERGEIMNKGKITDEVKIWNGVILLMSY